MVCKAKIDARVCTVQTAGLAMLGARWSSAALNEGFLHTQGVGSQWCAEFVLSRSDHCRYPKKALVTAEFGEWDDEVMDWWNPCPKSFREVMDKRGKSSPAPKNSIHGIIERDREGTFIASITKKGIVASVTGRTPNEAKKLLKDRLKTILGCESVPLVLKPVTPLADHQCNLLGGTGG